MAQWMKKKNAQLIYRKKYIYKLIKPIQKNTPNWQTQNIRHSQYTNQLIKAQCPSSKGSHALKQSCSLSILACPLQAGLACGLRWDM